MPSTADSTPSSTKAQAPHSRLGFHIAGRPVGPGEPVYVVAEMSANHLHDLDRAMGLLDAAKEAGVDAVKLQTYTADTLTIDCDGEPFRVGPGTLWEGRTLYDLYGEAHTPWEWHQDLAQRAAELDMHLFSTPFDATAVEFLEDLDVPAHKIASFEIVDLDLIRRVAETGKPIIMSTGMASLAEIEEAVQTVRGAGNSQLALLKCTSAYPSPPEAMNLNTIPHLAQAFDVVVGLSDHTLGVAVPVTAVALGISIVEKHFTLSRNDPGPDSAFSLEPHELKDMVDAIRVAEKALGRVTYGGGPKEKDMRAFRRSLFIVEDVQAGAMLTPDNVRSIRPGQGLPPRDLPKVLGRRAATDLKRGTPLSWDHLAAPMP